MTVVALGALLVSGCASTYQKRSVKGSGFLSDYAQLKDHGGDSAMLSYRNAKADFKGYTKILPDPVRVYVPGKDSKIAFCPERGPAEAGELLRRRAARRIEAGLRAVTADPASCGFA